jgi:RimJ/RimL family protein N-acetyltransferase
MSVSNNTIPSATIEALARGLFRETVRYGFKQVDYLRFVNVLLDMSMKNGYQAEIPQNIALNYDPQKKMGLPLIGAAIQVREFVEKNDIQILKKWLAEKEGKQFLICRTTAEAIEIEESVRNKRNLFGIITLNDGQQLPIGLLAFLHFDKIHQKAELRKLIGEPDYRGRGLAKEATQLWLQFGISTLGLKKIYLNTLDTNIRNIKLNEELGFKVEGILRNECFIDGIYHDVLKMAYLVE